MRMRHLKSVAVAAAFATALAAPAVASPADPPGCPSWDIWVAEGNPLAGIDPLCFVSSASSDFELHFREGLSLATRCEDDSQEFLTVAS